MLHSQNIGPSLLEGDYSAACRILVECIARPLNSARSRIFNSNLILPKCRRQLEFGQIYTFCLNFTFNRILPSASILRQLESEQNVRFYLNLAQYIMYPSATLQNKKRFFLKPCYQGIIKFDILSTN